MASKNKVLVLATSRKTRGGITSVVLAHEQGKQWNDYNCLWIETVRDGSPFIKVLYFIRALFKFIYKLPNAKIIHVHSALGTSIRRKNIFIRIAKLFKKKIIIHFHAADSSSLDDPTKTQFYRKIFLKADLIIVLSDSWKKLLINKLNIPTDKIQILYNPAPIVNHSKQKDNFILFAGTLIKRKGYDILIKAFALIANKPKAKNWKLVLAGNGETEEATELIKAHNLTERVILPGWISGKEKHNYFNKAAIFCLPSMAEGFPMAILDAWAYEIPCLLTPVGGIPELVNNGEDGILVPVGDIDKLAESLLTMIESPSLRELIVANSNKRLEHDFNIDILTAKLGNIYNSLIY